MSSSQNKMMSSMATPTRRRRGLSSKLGPSGMSGFGNTTATTSTSSVGRSGSFDNNSSNNNDNVSIPAQVSPLGGSDRSYLGGYATAGSIASASAATASSSSSKVGGSLLKPSRRVISLSPPLARRGTVSKTKISSAPSAPPFNEDDHHSNSTSAAAAAAAAKTTEKNGSSISTTSFERKAPRREKSHDIDDEYFMGIPKTNWGNRRRKYFTAATNNGGGGGEFADSSAYSTRQSNWFSSYYASKVMNHKLSLIIIQIIGLFLIVVMVLGMIVILQQGFGVVERGFQEAKGGGVSSPSSPYHQAIDAMNNPPRSAQVTPELLEKLHHDNQLQHEELENLKKELKELHDKQEQQQKNSGLKDVLQRSAGDAAGDRPPVAAAAAAAAGGGSSTTRARSPIDQRMDKLKQKSELERQKKLRGATVATGGAGGGANDQLPPAEKDVHLINRSPWEIQVFWISQNVIGYDPDDGTPQVEWMLMSGEEDRNIMPSTTYHFHARPSHKFGIRRYPSNDHVIYVAPEFPQDQYIVLTEDFTIEMINDHDSSGGDAPQLNTE